MLNNIYLTVSIFLGILNIIQFFKNNADKKILENILTTAHNALEGINYSINQIISNAKNFSQKEDIVNSLTPLSFFVQSMARAIEEQRFYHSLEEVKKVREKSKFEIQKLLNQIKKEAKKQFNY